MNDLAHTLDSCEFLVEALYRRFVLGRAPAQREKMGARNGQHLAGRDERRCGAARRWKNSPEARSQVLAFAAQGWNYNAIAAACGCLRATVGTVLRLARRRGEMAA